MFCDSFFCQTDIFYKREKKNKKAIRYLKFNMASSLRSQFKFPVYFMNDVFHKVLPFHMAKGKD